MPSRNNLRFQIKYISADEIEALGAKPPAKGHFSEIKLSDALPVLKKVLCPKCNSDKPEILDFGDGGVLENITCTCGHAWSL
ncbi:hypothetical protein KAR91_33915 [Candidatus Pacearchaeota archaeon]|nr:hypothetical protein [Candidatus Pacearchaeota archaeon]